jgi:hypothetical protein
LRVNDNPDLIQHMIPKDASPHLPLQENIVGVSRVWLKNKLMAAQDGFMACPKSLY